ncbi:F-box protein At5g07610-like [Aristolochia californica]|uniref:F-box protein At5g07610-like n=1 Tax=Aristolochia californica TaxID=171875 RepID=UPI0035DE721F
MEMQNLISSEQTSDKSINSYLGDDLLTEILACLPVKPLFRFKCVSKLWNRLISSDRLQRRLQLPPGLFYRFQVRDSEPEEYSYISLSDANSDDGGIQDISLSFLPQYPNIEIIDSCNGLILLLWLEMDEGTCQMEYYVCNPLNKRWVALPKPRGRVGFDLARLAFDPTVSPDFQVIHIGNPSDWEVTSVMAEIFSSSTGQWVESRHPCEPVSPLFLPQISVFLNGILYFLILPWHILGFNVRGGACRLIRLPEERRHHAFLKLSKGCIYYVNNDNSVINVWTIEDTSTCDWSLKHTVTMKALEQQVSLPICDRCWYDLYHHSFHPFDVHPERETVFLKTHCKIFSYHFMSSTLEELCCAEECTGLFSASVWFFESVSTYKPCPNALDWTLSCSQSMQLVDVDKLL